MSKDSRLSIALTLLLKASLSIKGHVSKNVVVLRGEEVFKSEEVMTKHSVGFQLSG